MHGLQTHTHTHIHTRKRNKYIESICYITKEIIYYLIICMRLGLSGLTGTLPSPNKKKEHYQVYNLNNLTI